MACIAVWLWVTRSQKEYLLFLFIFLFASASNSEFFIVSESHVAAALYFALIPLILLKQPWKPGTTLLAIPLAIFTFRSYESMLILGPILATMSLWRGVMSHSLSGSIGWLVLSGWFVAGAAVALLELVYPAHPDINSATFGYHFTSLVLDNMLSALLGSSNLHFEGMFICRACFA